MHVKDFPELFLDCRIGLEREAMRIDTQGYLSKRPHREVLGDALSDPYIGMDFSDVQPELRTPPMAGYLHAENFLFDLHCIAQHKIVDELLWPFSTPPILPKEGGPLADFGSSPKGQEMKLYREGLVFRYGPHMQMNSGIHYNFSFPERLWETLFPRNRKEKITKAYLHIIRNFMRQGWILSYLFGASPAIDQNYMHHLPMLKKSKNSLFGPHSTTLRMSPIGYYSRIQSQLAISLNSIDEYIRDMRFALETTNPSYDDPNARQLNNHYLQITGEHYTRIRAKSPTQGEENELLAIEKNGIQYLEVRCIDNDPRLPLGIDKNQADFIHLFIIHCFAKKSPPLGIRCQQELVDCQNRVALFGRDPGLKLRCGKSFRFLKTKGKMILNEMEELASIIGEDFEKTLEIQREKIEDPELTPSHQILEEIHKKGYIESGIAWAQAHKNTFLQGKSHEL